MVTIDWSMESIQIFLKLNGLFKAEVDIPATIMQFLFYI